MKNFRRSLIACVVWMMAILSLSAQIPAGYYDSANGLSGWTLKTALYNIIKNHNAQSYTPGVWNAFQTTDIKTGNIIWDMYSDIPSGTPAYTYTYGTDQCGSSNSEGDCYNREHSMPASWFNDGTPMYSDLFILYPTDGYVNNKRSNYPFGEVNSPSWTSTNGSKLGPCSYPGYTGTVFEPRDDFKGDFARTYFYIATRYENVIAGWASNSTEATATLAGNNTTTFKTWALNMLYQWHIDDPVSAKEIARNNAVYLIQNNRNPYIDHPEWVATVWFPSTGIETVNPEMISIGPNPANDYIKVNFPATFTFEKLYVVDVTGRCLINQFKPENGQQLDVSKLSKGIYFLKISSSSQEVTKVFIKN